MYAKLVVATNNGAFAYIRDMCKLLTSSAPSVSDLTGGGFSTSSSVILDNTPAGWTFVGSTADTNGVIGSNSGGAAYSPATFQNWCVSAPCAGNSSQLKYAVFVKCNNFGSTATAGQSQQITMCGATGCSSSGVLTNAGGYVALSNTAPNGVMNFSAGAVVHLVATPRHVTVIVEGASMCAIWESTPTDVTTFYNQAPFIQYQQNTGLVTAISGATGQQSAGSIYIDAFNITDVNTGTNYGALDITKGGTQNLQNLFQNSAATRAMSINTNNVPKYQISPVWYQFHWLGHPAQYVTGVVPIYWCMNALGNTGDSVAIGSDTYTYFNASPTFGVLMKTS